MRPLHPFILCVSLCLLAPVISRAAMLTVGHKEANIVGNDNFAIQEAIDKVAASGGGEVVIKAGEYVCYNSVFVRDNIHLRGEGAVILRKNDGFARLLTSDCGFYYFKAKVADPSEWQVGWGITIQAGPQAAGFFDNVRTIKAIEGDDLILDRDVDGSDYTVAGGAVVQNTYPLIAGYNVTHAVVESIICDGNKDHNPLLTGCRGGAIFLFKSEHCEIRNCVGRNFHGDGISFQVCPYTTVTGCEVYGNTGLGFHPGAGSHHTAILDSKSYNNGDVGLFLCWRVAESRFEGNHIYDNAGYGISIGHKDTDNVFRNNVIENNKGYGIYLRPEPAYNAGHRCIFENNRIINNSGPDGAAIWVDGATTGIRVLNNEIADTRGAGAAGHAFYVGKDVSDLVARENRVSGFAELLLNESAASDVHVE